MITSATPVDIPKELLIYPKDQLFIRAPSVQNPESQPICIAEDTSFALRVDVRNPWPFEIVVSHFRIITTTKWCLNCSVNMPRKIEPNTVSHLYLYSSGVYIYFVFIECVFILCLDFSSYQLN